MIIDAFYTPTELKRVRRVTVNGEDVTKNCFRLDTVTGTAWVYKRDEHGQIKRGKNYREWECLTGVVEVEWRQYD